MTQDKWKHIIDIIQWILIIGLLFVACFIYFGKCNRENVKIQQSEEKYVQIYESQKIAALEKQNKELYDSIKNLKNVESAIEIKYVYKTKTDTITVEKFTQKEDSIWTVEVDNDTVKTNIEIKANDLKWCNVTTEINDTFKIVTQHNEDTNEVITEIEHSPNVEITGMDAWHKKKKWTEHFHHGPSITAGYDIINQRFGMMIGYSIIFEF